VAASVGKETACALENLVLTRKKYVEKVGICRDSEVEVKQELLSTDFESKTKHVITKDNTLISTLGECLEDFFVGIKEKVSPKSDDCCLLCKSVSEMKTVKHDKIVVKPQDVVSHEPIVVSPVCNSGLTEDYSCVKRINDGQSYKCDVEEHIGVEEHLSLNFDKSSVKKEEHCISEEGLKRDPVGWKPDEKHPIVQPCQFRFVCVDKQEKEVLETTKGHEAVPGDARKDHEDPKASPTEDKTPRNTDDDCALSETQSTHYPQLPMDNDAQVRCQGLVLHTETKVVRLFEGLKKSSEFLHVQQQSDTRTLGVRTSWSHTEVDPYKPPWPPPFMMRKPM